MEVHILLTYLKKIWGKITEYETLLSTLLRSQLTPITITLA